MVVHVQVADSFRGPMDLLLYLIQRDEIDIHDIPIAHITGEYLRAIEAMQNLDVERSTEFMALASMLVEIKSRMLLPPDEAAEDEETIEVDPRSELVEALLEYKRFKDAADSLEALYERHRLRFPRTTRREAEATDPDEAPIEADVYGLFAAFARLMRETLAGTAATTIVQTELSMDECVEHIDELLRAHERLTFRELFADVPSRPEMVVFFMALLELVRRQAVRAYQAEPDAEIYIERAAPEAPPARIVTAPSTPAQATRGTAAAATAGPVLHDARFSAESAAPEPQAGVAPFLPVPGREPEEAPVGTPFAPLFAAVPVAMDRTRRTDRPFVPASFP